MPNPLTPIMINVPMGDLEVIMEMAELYMDVEAEMDIGGDQRQHLPRGTREMGRLKGLLIIRRRQVKAFIEIEAAPGKRVIEV